MRLKLIFIRHVQSSWNEWKKRSKWGKLTHINLVHPDACLSDVGKKQINYIFNNFGDTVFDLIKSEFENGKIHIESSNLRRAQFTAFALWKSLINAAKQKQQQLTTMNTDGDTDVYQQTNLINILNELENSNFYIVQNLQESSFGLDAWSMFDANTFFDKNCQKWIKYLQDGWSHHFELKSHNTWDNIMSNEFLNNLCINSQYHKAGWSSNNNLIELLKYKLFSVEINPRMDLYGKWLYTQMMNGVKLIIVSGHSIWFQQFVDTFGKSINSKYGTNGVKLMNGMAVDINIEAINDKHTIAIKTIEKIFEI